MSWHIADGDFDYCELSELLDIEISTLQMFTLKETKELAESFDEGPKSDVFIVFENHSDETITLKEAIENKWYVISYTNYKNKYVNDPTSMCVNLGCADEYDKDILEEYLIKQLGYPNFCGISMDYNYDTIEDFVENESSYDPYDLGWIGDEYGVFITIRKDEVNNYDGQLWINIDGINIVPVESLKYVQDFLTIDETVYNSNLIKKE